MDKQREPEATMVEGSKIDLIMAGLPHIEKMLRIFQGRTSGDDSTGALYHMIKEMPRDDLIIMLTALVELRDFLAWYNPRIKWLAFTVRGIQCVFSATK